MEYREEREMTISLKEFYRLLPHALRNTEYYVTDNIIFIKKEKGKIEIYPGEEGSRSIASLNLPNLKVLFVFNDITDDEITRFFTNFNRAYQRGGG